MEAERATGIKVDSRARYYIFKDRAVELKEGMEFWVHLGRPPHLKHEERDIKLHLRGQGEPIGSEYLVQYGSELFRVVDI